MTDTTNTTAAAAATTGAIAAAAVAAPQRHPLQDITDTIAAGGGALAVVYTPLDDGDPHVTSCRGVRFKANIAQPVRDPVLIDLLKANPWFEVEGFEKATRPDGRGMPTTPEQYRRHSTQWFPLAQSYDEFQLRWRAEEKLREKCGVGEDDLAWLETIADPILFELKKIKDAEGA
jgi:hypothetical protein